MPEKTRHYEHSGGKTSKHEMPLYLRTTPIAWGFPGDELMFYKFFANIFHLGYMPWDNVITTESTYLPDARNTIHKIYYEEMMKTHPYLFMIDTDVLAPPGTIPKLLEHDKPLVGGWYKKKEKFEVKDPEGNVSYIQRPVVYDWEKEEGGKWWFVQRMKPGEGLENVAGAGAGCWLMRRDIAKRLGKEPYSMEQAGEDLVMCKKVLDLGETPWIDWDIECAHTGVFYV